jgi:hypothetical protein
MPESKRHFDGRPREKRWHGAAVLLLILFAVGACSPHQPEGSFEVLQVDADWNDGRLAMRFQQQLKLSPEARNALDHSVPLTVVLDLVLRDDSSRVRIDSRQLSYEIRYLPLSERYQVSGPDGQSVASYPRLRHALAKLAKLDVSIQTGAIPAGEYVLLARTRLDRNAMPPPMRLPSLFSADWKHDSDWSSWPVSIDPGA